LGNISMKHLRMLLAPLALALFAVPSLAGEGTVSKSTLNSLGLSGMQVMSDAEGMQIRGMHSSASSTSVNSVSVFLIDPATGSNTAFNAASHSTASDDSFGSSTTNVTSGFIGVGGFAVFNPGFSFGAFDGAAVLGGGSASGG